MPEYDARAAARDRDSGLRKVSRITWRAGAAGVAFTAVIGVALTHHSAATASAQQQSSRDQHSSRDQKSSGSRPGSRRQQSSRAQQNQTPDPVQVPAQPPQQSAGNGQVTSGAS